MTRPLQITSTTHAAALGLYALALVLGVEHAVGIAPHPGMSALAGPGGVALWCALLVTGAATALAGALAAPHAPVPSLPLAVEGAGATALAVAWAVYEWSLASMYGGTAPTTQTLAVGLAAGCIARAAQAVIELRHIRAAQAHPAPPVEVLADPTDHD